MAQSKAYYRRAMAQSDDDDRMSDLKEALVWACAATHSQLAALYIHHIATTQRTTA